MNDIFRIMYFPTIYFMNHFFQVILTVYAAAGGILVIQQLLCIVLACCYANQLEKYDGDYDEHWDYDQNYSHSRPGTPHSMRYNNNETTF